MMESAVRKLFERYEHFCNQSLNGNMDMDEMVSLYASDFIAASPAGVMSGKNDNQLKQARAWVARFVRWYNRGHRHSAIRFITPEQRHMGLDTVLLAQRQAVYEAARARASHRWSGPLRNWSRIDVVHLTPDKNSAEASSAENNLRRAA